MAASREDKLARIALLEEKAKRDRLKNPPYKPTGKQLDVIMCRKPERYLFCANGFGKSTILVNEVHWAATGYNPFTKEHSAVPAKICLVIDDPTKIEDFITEYKKWNPLSPDQLHKRGKAHYSAITYPNGSTVTVLTHNVEPLRLEGSQWTHMFFDEPPPKRVFTGIARGGRIKGRPAKLLLAGTPISAAWLRVDIYDKWIKGELEGVECFRGLVYDNADNLDMESVKRNLAKLSPNERKIREEGQFFDLEGLALAHLFKRSTHTIAREKLYWDINYPCVVAIDPHTSKKNHAVLLGVNRDNEMFVLDEFAARLTARQFMQELIKREWFLKYKILDIIYDSAGNADMTSGENFKPFGVVINEVLAQHKLTRARPTSFDEKSDEAFLDRIQDALLIKEGSLIPKLRVVSDCIGLITDCENVEWMADKKNETTKPKLNIMNKDFLSCLKYALATNLYYKKSKDKAYYVTRPMYGLPSKTHGKIIHNASLLRPRGPK